MKYEAGMVILYDVVKKSVFIEFRDLTYYLPGPYPSHKEGVAAGEELCRSMGWGSAP
jgi:hypothetical protein